MPAIEFLKFHNLPLNDFEDWVPKNDTRKFHRLPDSYFIENAKQYRLRSDWKKHSNGEYQHVYKKRKQLIPICTAHMEANQGPFQRGYQLYAYEFEDNSVYVGITCNPKRRHRDHSKRGSVFEKSKTCACKFAVLQQRLDPTPATEAEKRAIESYEGNGWALINVATGGSTGHVRTKYTYDVVLKMARPFKTKKEFYTCHSAMYQTVTRLGWVERLENDLGWPRHAAHKWTKSSCSKEASKFEYLSDWSSQSAASYQAAKKHGWFDAIKADHFNKRKKPPSKWTYDACLNRSKLFTSKSKWQYGCKDGSYATARRKGWLNSIWDKRS